MNHPEIAKIGLGNVDPERLKKSIDILVEANGLPRTPTVDGDLHAGLPAAGRRSAEETVLTERLAARLLQRRGHHEAAAAMLRDT